MNKIKPTTISKEIKAKVIAQYLGCKTSGIFENDFILKGIFQSAYEDDDFIATIGSRKNFIEQHEVYIEDLKLLLKPISSITDEHLKDLARLNQYRVDKDSVKYVVSFHKDILLGTKTDISIRNPECWQYLQSVGYDIPNYHLGGKTLEQSGLAIYE